MKRIALHYCVCLSPLPPAPFSGRQHHSEQEHAPWRQVRPVSQWHPHRYTCTDHPWPRRKRHAAGGSLPPSPAITPHGVLYLGAQPVPVISITYSCRGSSVIRGGLIRNTPLQSIPGSGNVHRHCIQRIKNDRTINAGMMLCVTYGSVGAPGRGSGSRWAS